jgi:transposase-like protein
MKPERKREVIELVRRSPVTKKETLLELGMSPSTFYRWQRRFRSEDEAGLVDRLPQPGTIWNRLRPEETETILVAARAEPDKSPQSRMNLLVWASPEELRAAIAEFIDFYNQRRYHEGIGNVAPADVYYGRREEILKRREEQKRQTLYERFQYNRAQRNHATRLLTAPKTTNPSVALGATTTTKTGEPDDSNRS